MAVEVEVLGGAGCGEVGAGSVNSCDGYRDRRFDARVGTIDPALPKLCQGSYHPDWLLEPSRRAEKTLVPVVADCYQPGVSTCRVDKFVKTLGTPGLSKPVCVTYGR